jgi:putative restriction endonuclease
MFNHLDRLLVGSASGVLSSRAINTFIFEAWALRLVVQTGIWKPAGLSAALLIRTTYTPPNELPPRADDVGENGLVRYKYRGTDPNHSDNRALREAMIQSLPIAYFVGVDRGGYIPRYLCGSSTKIRFCTT